MRSIIPVLLAGGSGKRLWPLSRKSYPKQFSNIIGTNSLFQESALRLISSDQILFEKHITVTNSDFRFIVSEQLQKIGIDPGPILIEPQSKNTAPAILAAALYAIANDKDAILLVSPSDHLIPDIKEFHDTLLRGLKEVLDGKIVTMGIYPTRPETGYGYLSLSKATQYDSVTVKQFIEKPDEPTAQSMINAGIHDGDLLVVDRSIEPQVGKIVIAAIQHELTVKRYVKKDGKVYLAPENDDYEPILVSEEDEVHIWGVVTNVVHAV